jgi:cholesterol oxidase
MAVLPSEEMDTAEPCCAVRLIRVLVALLRQPIHFLRAWVVDDWAKWTMILLYMRTLKGHLRLRLGGFGLTTAPEGPRRARPSPRRWSWRGGVEQKIAGFAGSLLSETILGTPTTAHILGGDCMGTTAENGVIDDRHRIFGYDGLDVIDSAAMSANPGVNPSLTITAQAEQAMSFIPRGRKGHLQMSQMNADQTVFQNGVSPT